MPDFKVTFRGDLGNLAQFDSAIKNSALSSARALQSANQQIASLGGKIDGIYRSDAAGRFIKNQKAVADSVNNTFRQSGDVVRRFVKDYEVLQTSTGKFVAKPIFDTAYISSFDKARGNLELYNKALVNVQKDEAELIRARKNFATGTATRQTQLAANAARRKELQADLIGPKINVPTEFLRDAEAKYTEAYNAYSAMRPGQRGIVQLRKNLNDTANVLAQAKADLAAARAPLEAELAELGLLDKKLEAAQLKAAGRLGTAERNIPRRQSYKDLRLAALATPPINADLQRVLNDSKDLQSKLLKGGLGLGTQYGTADFQRALAKQEAQVTSYTRNLRTNVRTVAGEFKNNEGLLNKFTVDLDDQGKVIGRWGGQLGGAGSILRQTVRDFQKVIEWTIATTAVIGSLGAVIAQLKSINELNTALTRFSITAQTSAEETNTLFQALSQVAINTATPLKEIVTVADDIALATREAGISTTEWQTRIVQLTQAVGIFTNLTGKDTVQAADQLSSAFKQLDISPAQLIGVLNKVTAVAGGQATAIADIVQSLAGLAEAGKAAGLSIDQQIASVQVLSQVTNKTSAEVATSFKNLFGSISSVGSEKILSEFGIAVRDATGGVRDFLDIYGDISRALSKGIIPQERLPDVLRGIAGGPRRAPDAAALLSNYDRIQSVISTSFDASNEALIANAKVLDTNQAKLIQFQNAIDAAVFQEFGQAVKELTASLTDFGTSIAGVLNFLGSGFVTAALKLGIMVTGLLTLNKVLGLLSRALGVGAIITGLKNMATGFKEVAFQASASQIAIDNAFVKRQQQLQGPNPLGLGMLGTPSEKKPFNLRKFAAGNKAGLLLGAAGILGTGAALASGQDNSGIASALQIGGTIATLIPGLQAVGIAAAVAGTAIQLFGENSQKSKTDSAQLSQEVYSLSQSLKSVQEEADLYGKQQKDALSIIEKYQGKAKKTAEEQTILSDATKNYVTATLALADANKRVDASFDELLKKLPELNKEYRNFTRAKLSPKFLEDLRVNLSKDILKNTGFGQFTGPPISTATQFRQGNAINAPNVTVSEFTGRGPATKTTIDFADLINNPELLKKLFSLDVAGARRGAIPTGLAGNQDAVSAIQIALGKIFDQQRQGQETGFTDEQMALLVKIFSELSTTVSSFTQNAAALTQQSAEIQSKLATGRFTQEQASNATVANTLAQTLNDALNSYSPSSERGAPSPIPQKATGLIDTFKGLADQGIAPTNSQLTEMARLILVVTDQMDNLGAAGKDAIGLGIIETLRGAGVEQDILNQLVERFGLNLRDAKTASDELFASLQAAKTAAAERFADRSLQLLIAENSGDFEKNAAGLKVLQDQNKAAYDSTLQLIDAMGQLSDGAFVTLNNALSQVIGMTGNFITEQQFSALSAEDQATMIAQVSGKLVENAVAAGVNADGIKKLRDEVARLIAAILAIPSYKQVIIDIQERIQSPFGSPTAYGTAAKELAKAQAQQGQSDKSLQKILNNFLKTVNGIFQSGRGNTLGKLPTVNGSRTGGGRTGGTSAPAYNPPGLLDVPEEILQQSNVRELLQRAIRNAKSLQSKIPGATKENRSEIVEILNGTKRLLEVRGVGEEFLRRAMDELRDEIKRQNDMLSKADTIRRIRVGAGDFAAIANVPVNSLSGVSLGQNGGTVNIDLNVNGSILTPAQLSQFADLIAASLKRQLAS